MPPHATAPEHPRALKCRTPWTLDVRTGDPLPDLQDWLACYVALVLELEGVATRGAPSPAPPEAIAA